MKLSRLHNAILSLAAIAGVLATGCEKATEPANPEPVIEVLPATEISRTEAVVGARIDSRGGSGLTRLALLYGENGSLDRQTSVGDPQAARVEMRLTGLTPGTSYSYCFEGGTASALLRSDVLSFTTDPNVLPTVTAPVALSTGPTGAIIEFEITNDGGEAVTAAGCEVTSDGDTRRIILAEPAKGVHRLTISGLTPLVRYTVTAFAANTIGEAKSPALEYTPQEGIVLKAPGELAEVFAGSTAVTLGKLTVSGAMNGDDFRFLRMLLGAPALPGDPVMESNVTEADLTEVHIVEGGRSYDGVRYTEPDKVSTGLLADCVRLRTVMLPASAAELSRDALAHCPALERLTISAGIATLLPSGDCPSLRAIEVSAANTEFASVDGVLFNHEGTDILWFPLGKTGTYTLPSTVTRIGEDAFAGTGITALVIPPTVTEIGRGAFAGSALEEISLPDNMSNISEGMFQSCAHLGTVRAGSGTRYVGNYAFDGTALAELYVGATVPPFVAAEALVNGSTTLPETCVLHVPAGCKKIYRNHKSWGLFEHIEEYNP